MKPIVFELISKYTDKLNKLELVLVDNLTTPCEPCVIAITQESISINRQIIEDLMTLI